MKKYIIFFALICAFIPKTFVFAESITSVINSSNEHFQALQYKSTVYNSAFYFNYNGFALNLSSNLDAKFVTVNLCSNSGAVLRMQVFNDTTNGNANGMWYRNDSLEGRGSLIATSDNYITLSEASCDAGMITAGFRFENGLNLIAGNKYVFLLRAVNSLTITDSDFASFSPQDLRIDVTPVLANSNQTYSTSAFTMYGVQNSGSNFNELNNNFTYFLQSYTNPYFYKLENIIYKNTFWNNNNTWVNNDLTGNIAYVINFELNSDMPYISSIDGVCGSDHFYCMQGESESTVGSSTTQWLWTCKGQNGGQDVSCTEDFNPQEDLNQPPDVPEYQVCESWLDIGCHVYNLGLRIKYAFDFFSYTIKEAILKFVVYWFVPSSDILDRTIKTITFSDKIPFAYATNFGTLYDQLMNDTTGESYTISFETDDLLATMQSIAPNHTTSYPTIGKITLIDFCSFDSNYGGFYHNTILPLLRVFLWIGFLFELYLLATKFI